MNWGCGTHLRTAICKFHFSPQCPSFVPDDTVWGITPFYPCLEILPMPTMSSMVSVLWDIEVQFFICRNDHKDSWIGSALSVSGFLFQSHSMKIVLFFPLFLGFALPVFPFSWIFPHLINTCICNNLFWASLLINSCVSVGILYYFFTYTACFTWICCYPVS